MCFLLNLIHAYIYIHIYTHTHTHIYIYINKESVMYGLFGLFNWELSQAEQDSESAFGDPGQFEKVANMLQAEVKKRIGTRLRQYLELQTLNAPDAPAAGT